MDRKQAKYKAIRELLKIGLDADLARKQELDFRNKAERLEEQYQKLEIEFLKEFQTRETQYLDLETTVAIVPYRSTEKIAGQRVDFRTLETDKEQEKSPI